jgi:hypothetical protein
MITMTTRSADDGVHDCASACSLSPARRNNFEPAAEVFYGGVFPVASLCRITTCGKVRVVIKSSERTTDISPLNVRFFLFHYPRAINYSEPLLSCR